MTAKLRSSIATHEGKIRRQSDEPGYQGSDFVVGRFLDPSDLDLRALSEPESRWIVVARDAVERDVDCVPQSPSRGILVKERVWRVGRQLTLLRQCSLSACVVNLRRTFTGTGTPPSIATAIKFS
jgi:hypothetical protein